MQFDCDCGMATAYEDPPECPECGRRMKHLRLEVLEREHGEFFERWHAERRKREAMDVAMRDVFPVAHRMALELECLLLSCTDTAAQAKWWDSAHEALEQWREFCREDSTHNAVAHREAACGRSGGAEC